MIPAPPQLRRRLCIASAMSAVLAAALTATAQTPAPAPVAGPLQQLSDQTRQIYQQVRADVIRVRLPATLWAAQLRQEQRLELHRFLERWGTELKPDARLQLLAQEQRLAATEPTTRPQPADRSADRRPAVAVAAVATALLIDNNGHAMLPLFVDPAIVDGSLLTVIIGNGQVAAARVIGADLQTNLSVLQIQPASASDAPLTLPPAATLAAVRPDDGQLVLLLAPEGGGRVILWDDSHVDPGLAVCLDGSVAGFCFNGQFLAASACRPIVQQLIATGSVHRAALGVWVRDIRRDDPLRLQIANLAVRRAIYVDKVVPDSLAQHAGLRAGDVIVAAAGQAVEDRATFAAIIATRSGTTDLQILRGADSITITVDLSPQ